MTFAQSIRTQLCSRSFAWLRLLGLMALTGCGSLLPGRPPQPTLFLLEDLSADPVDMPFKPALATATATLVVSEPSAASGYGTRKIAYARAPDQIEYFAFNQWVEPPALMLAPLLAHAAERTGAFRAVVRAPLSVAADIRVETELVRLQQDFSTRPSRVRLTLHAVLIDAATRRVLATREFEAEAPSAGEDPAAGVLAANQAAHLVAAEVGAFCAEWVEKTK